MAIAKIEPPSKSDMGSKIVPWEKRHAAGRELRRAVPRESHAEWKLWYGRPDPLKLLAASNKSREADLIPLRMGWMAASAERPKLTPRRRMKANSVSNGVSLHVTCTAALLKVKVNYGFTCTIPRTA